MQPVTIHDIAKAAGVSAQTVSRVLNDRPDVAAETRNRVKKVVAELGFVPHAAARKLSSGRNNVIGYLGTRFAHPYWSRLVLGVHTLCSERGIGFALGNTVGGIDEERRQLNILLEQGVDGIVVSPVSVQSDVVREIRDKNVPVVGLLISGDGAVDVGRLDDAGGIRALTEMLLARGRRRIAWLGPKREVVHASQRRSGYESALADAGIPLQEEIIRHLYTTLDNGRRATLELLDSEEPPDALLAASRVLAAGALEAFDLRGVEMPGKIAFAAYGGALQVPRGITHATCEPIEQLGYRAAQMLLERIGGYDGPGREYVLAYQMHAGTSSG